FHFTTKTDPNVFKQPNQGGLSDFALGIHGVNNAMAMKTSVVWSQVSNDSSDRQAIYQMLAMLDKYHGHPTGMFRRAGHYGGSPPSGGGDLGAVVEYVSSPERAFVLPGGPYFPGGREGRADSARPATMSGDMWSHQYDQQPNQVLCSLEKRHWTSNGP